MPRRRRNGDVDMGGVLALGMLFILIIVALSILRWITENLWILAAPIVGGVAIAVYFGWDWHRERARRRKHQRELELHEVDEDLFVGRMMQLSPEDFEHFCARALATRGLMVEVTQRTNDGGVDIVLRGRDGAPGVAQCKRWINRSIDRPVVQKLYGEMVHRGSAFGVILATCRFTDGARRWASDKEIELIDVEDLILFMKSPRLGPTP